MRTRRGKGRHSRENGDAPREGAISKAGASSRGGRQGRAAVERLCGGQRNGHSPPGRPGVGRPRENTGRDARCATTKRSTPGVRNRGTPVPGSAGGTPGTGAFPRRPALPGRPALFREEKQSRALHLPPFGVLAASPVLRRRHPRSAALRKRGKVAPPPLIVMRQSRRKKRPPLAPKDTA